MNIEAIVIRKVPIREHDQLVVLYSESMGKMAASARGSLRAHSTQALAIDEGNRISCELVDGKSGPIMTGAQASRSFSHIKGSPLRWAAAQFFLQAVDAIVYEAQPDAHLWGCLCSVLGELDAARDEHVLTLFRQGQGAMLDAFGYGTQDDATIASQVVSRSKMDEQFEAIAQRRLSSLDLFYDVAARVYS